MIIGLVLLTQNNAKQFNYIIYYLQSSIFKCGDERVEIKRNEPAGLKFL